MWVSREIYCERFTHARFILGGLFWARAASGRERIGAGAC